MNQKGVTLVELLIVIVVMGLLTAFATVGISELLSNVRKNSFIQEANIVVDAARLSYTGSPEIWADDQATFRELVENNYIQGLDTDPWGGTYNLDQSVVVLEELGIHNSRNTVTTMSLNNAPMGVGKNMILKVTIVTTKATLGLEGALDIYSKDDIVLFNPEDEGLFQRVVSNITGSVTQDVTLSDSPDELNIEKGIKGKAIIETNGGDDVLNVQDDMKGSASINTGSGNDQLNVDGEIKGKSTLDMGDGDDVLTVSDDIEQDANISTGAGNDTITVADDFQHRALLDTGAGNDRVTISDDLDRGTILMGTGNDTLVVDTMKSRSNIDMGEGDDTVIISEVDKNARATVDLGAGNDTLTIYDTAGKYHSLQRDRSTYDGGSGKDTLYLPEVSLAEWNDYASNLFSGFETIVLQDTTLQN
jgi:prepilin-type N-terminal cleavage/methylation domain-containing protein